MTSFFDYPDGSADEAEPQQFAFLADASDDDWAAIRAHGELRHFRPGETVTDHGEVDRALFIVVDGQLEVVVADGRRHRERRVNTIEAGTVVGEIGFLDGRPRSAKVRAVVDSKLLRLTYEAFEVLAAKEPCLGRQILFDIGRVLADRLRDVETLTAPGLA